MCTFHLCNISMQVNVTRLLGTCCKIQDAFHFFDDVTGGFPYNEDKQFKDLTIIVLVKHLKRRTNWQ